MSMEQILETIRGFDGVLELAPAQGSEFPPIAWGDHFFYFAPDGQIPQREQPHTTIVTKDYPDDKLCHLDEPDRWRLNIHVGRNRLTELTGQRAKTSRVEGETAARDFTATDVIHPHPVYAAQGWVCIVNPGESTAEVVQGLLLEAHEAARRRSERV